MRPLQFAVLGTGFWSHYQIPAWKELEDVEPVAVYNRTRSRAEEIARKLDVPKVCDDVEFLLKEEILDFVDIFTDVDTHASFIRMAAEKGVALSGNDARAGVGPIPRTVITGSIEVGRSNVDMFLQNNAAAK
ncbi:MAG: Gfo/Idh/MocA family oxidoreductase [Flavisolibacter sp.]|nr:Gfo/Idh/MocA family oxidoreductase [Flavisolibacter sp.]